MTFVCEDGGLLTTIRRRQVVDVSSGARDLEVQRGELTEILHAAIRDDVELRFGDSVVALEDDDAGVDVTFTSGARRTFDVVVGADGLHSQTRHLAFGPEERFHHYLGYCFAGFTMANELGLSREAVLWNAPGRGAALYAVGDRPSTVHGFLIFRQPTPPLHAFRNPEAQRDLVTSMFAEDRWQVPRIVSAMRSADDIFFDVVSQIHMPRWSAGRVALVGDAAHAPSFPTGQGTSIALVGAYMLAGALAAHRDHATAFAAYERSTRAFVEMNQALVGNGKVTICPATPEDLAERNEALCAMDALPSERGEPAHSALTLPDVAVPASA
jgi:2-polyprenyl-6-methoxyphenol hydroxylase-like FAD-dependent oxidoreductase